MTVWKAPIYIAPTLWDRIRGYKHHDCEYCLDAARYPRLRVFHPPDYPPPSVSTPAPREGMVWVENAYGARWVATEDIEDAPRNAAMIRDFLRDEAAVESLVRSGYDRKAAVDAVAAGGVLNRPIRDRKSSA